MGANCFSSLLHSYLHLMKNYASSLLTQLAEFGSCLGYLDFFGI